MTQAALTFEEPITTRTYRDRVAKLFQQRPNLWIDGMEVASVGGVYAWRTRISECRFELGMRIENQQRRIGRRRVSEYRFTPESPGVRP